MWCAADRRNHKYHVSHTSAKGFLTLKEPGGGRNPPPSTFFVISQPVVIFSR